MRQLAINTKIIGPTRAWLALTASMLVALLLMPALWPRSVFATGVNDFTITSFQSDETLSRADPQGELHIIEKIDVDFAGNNHGITRAIPKSYKGNSLHFRLNKVSSSSGAPAEVKTSSQNGNTMLRIGNPNRTVTGSQEYTIDYTLKNVITFYDDHDELYWDVNGDQWGQPIDSVETTLELPSGLKLSSQKPVCYAGANDSTAQNCNINVASGRIFASALALGPSQTLTYVAGFQKGFFAPMTFKEKLAEHAVLIFGLIIPPLVGFIVGFGWWWKRGRDAKGKGTIVPHYDAPKGLSPLLAGALIDFKVDNRDLTGAIIDLARRGYMKVIETKAARKLRKASVSYSLELVNVDKSQLAEHELRLINAMFIPYEQGKVLKLDTWQPELGKAIVALRKKVVESLAEQGYLKRAPRKFGVSLTIIIFPAIFVGAFLIGLGVVDTLWPIIVGIVIGVLIFTVFMHLMAARTALGVEADEQLKGLKLYMETAEKDRIEKLEGPNAVYNRSSEPERTVEFFEKLLPYAIVLGVENQWAKKFDGIYANPPGWYVGNNVGMFNAVYLASALNSGFTSAMNSTFSAPSSSSSSGFSGGGGFAGGGGGGGGGGGW